MNHFVGIDVSLEQSSVCVVDAAGRTVKEAEAKSAANRASWRGT